MRLWWIVLATGCWSASKVPEPAPQPVVAVPAGTCRIQDRFEGDASGMTPGHLSLDGEVFARPSSILSLELTVQGGRTAKARVESEVAILAGDIPLSDVRVRPRSSDPIHGWLVVNGADLQQTKGRIAHVVATLPEGLAPRTLDIDIPCAELTTMRAEPGDEAGDLLVLTRSARLLRSPGGAEVAKVVVDTLEVHELERAGNMIRVAIVGDDSTLLGWVASAAAHRPTVGGGGTGWGTIGTGRYGSRKTVTCSRELAIYVRSPVRGSVRVGHLKPNQVLAVKAKDSTADERAVDLGGDLVAFVRVDELAGC